MNLGRIAVVGVAGSAILILFCMILTMRWEMQQLRMDAAVREKQLREHAMRIQQEREEHEARIKELLASRRDPLSEVASVGDVKADLAIQDRTEALRSATSKEDVAPAFLPRRPHEHKDKGDHREDRRLGSVFTNIVAHTSMAKGVGCVTVDASSAAVSLALNAKSCGSGASTFACPNCFIVTGVGNTITLSSCSAAYIGTSKYLGTGDYTNAVVEIVLINSASSAATISDGSNTNILGEYTSTSAYCYTGGSNRLYFSNNYFNNGLHTGTGSSGTGASMTGAGALTLDDDLTVSGATSLATATASSTLEVSGAATFNGAMTLGDAKTDTVTIKGDLVADGTTNPILDYSSSTGTFSTSLGTKTVGGTGTITIDGGLTVGGTTTLKGDIDLGNTDQDTIKFYGAVAASGTSADFNIGSSAFTSGASTLASLIVSGTATMQGTTALGNALGDTVTFNAHVASASAAVNFDFSSSTGSFKTPGDTIVCSTSATTVTGAATFSSSITVDGATTLKGNVGLGDSATGDTITITGAVAVADNSPSPAPAINLGTAALTAGTLDLSSTAEIDGAVTFKGTVKLGSGDSTDTIYVQGPLTSSALNHDMTGANKLDLPFNTNVEQSAGSTSSTVYDICGYATTSCTASA